MPTRDVMQLYRPFRLKVQKIQRMLTAWCDKHRPGSEPIITETYRTVKRQQELYAQGRTSPGPIVTQRDGVTRRSRHQDALAADFALKKVDGSIDWDDAEFYAYLGHCARFEMIHWGGDWASFKDNPHVEWPAEDVTTTANARAWAKRMKLD